MSADYVALVRALRTREERARTGWYVIEGTRFVVAASDAGGSFVALVVCEQLLKSQIGQIIVRRQRRAGVPVLKVTPEQYAQLSRLEDVSARGVIAIVQQRWRAIDRFGAHDLWLAVEDARSPGNLGTLMRTCLAVRARGVLVLGDIDVYDPTCVRATMGAIEGLELVRIQPAALIALARASGARLVGAAPDGALDFRRAPYDGSTVVVVGSERKGLSPTLRRGCDITVRIPMVGRIDSLNLAVAGSLILYEAFGRR